MDLFRTQSVAIKIEEDEVCGVVVGIFYDARSSCKSCKEKESGYIICLELSTRFITYIATRASAITLSRCLFVSIFLSLSMR